MVVLPSVLRLPLLLLILRVGLVHGVQEIDSAVPAAVARGAAELVHGVRRGATEEEVQLRVRAVRLLGVFEPGPIRGQVAGLAAIGPGHPGEVDVEGHLVEDHLLDLEGGRDEIEERGVQDVDRHLHEAGRRHLLEFLLQAAEARLEVVDLLLRLDDPAVDLVNRRLGLAPLLVVQKAHLPQLLELPLQFVHLLPGLHRLRGAGVHRLVIVEFLGVVGGFDRPVGEVVPVGSCLHVLQLPQGLFEIFGVLLGGGPGLVALLLQRRQGLLVEGLPGRLDLCPGLLRLEALKLFLVPLPAAAVVVVDHPPHGEEQPDAARREHEVQGRDFPQGLVDQLRHGRLSGGGATLRHQMLKKISGTVTT